MLFAYVYTEDDSFPIPLDDAQHAALTVKGCDSLTVLQPDLDNAGIDSGQVRRVEVETGNDADEAGYPDKDNPDTITVFTRELTLVGGQDAG